MRRSLRHDLSGRGAGVKLVLIHAPADKKLSAWLTQFWTGSTAYHCGFVDESDGTFFDMNLLPRKVVWPRYGPPKWINEYDMPQITRAMCEDYLKRDGSVRYGVGDYIMFGLRPIFHWFGKSTPNVGGMICSEMCSVWLNRAGYDAPIVPVQSPADLELWAIKTAGDA